MSRAPHTSSSQDAEAPVLSADTMGAVEATPLEALDLPTSDSKSEATEGGGAEPLAVAALADISSIL